MTNAPLGDVARSVLAVLAGLAGLGSAAPVSAQDAPTRADLEARVRELERRLGIGQEPEPAAAKEAPEPQVPHPARTEATHATPPGFWQIPGTDYAVNIGGYVKVDAIHDFQAIGNEFKFATQTIPVPTERQSRTNIFARESRLHVDVRGPAGEHDVRVFVEGDFYGSGNTFELRHAFGQLGGLLVGQTWTTYMDLSSRPHTLDFEGPDAELFVRQTMVRWTGQLEEFGSFSLAVEDSGQDFTTSGFTGDVTTPLPDLTGNLRIEGDGRHAQLSGVLRYLDFDGDAGSPDESTVGWGVALSGKTTLGAPGRRLMGQVSIGEGSAHYNQALRGSGSDAVLEANALEALPVITGVVGYEHDWSATWSSTLAWSMARVDTRESQVATAMEQSQSASINLVWHPSPRILTGVEYLWGERENLDGESGEAHRLQVSFKFTF